MAYRTLLNDFCMSVLALPILGELLSFSMAGVELNVDFSRKHKYSWGSARPRGTSREQAVRSKKCDADFPAK